MTRRGVSTVVDVSLFLLLISAATVSLVTASGAGGVDDGPTSARDEAAVETLATSTATVQYDLGADDRTGEPIERVHHGTLAALLSEAAVANVSVGSTPLSPDSTGFVDAVEGTVAPLLDSRTQVVATWRPAPGSGLRGEIRVGSTPPPGSTVHAATLTVASGIAPARGPARAAAPRGYGRVADVVSRRVVDGLFPARPTAVALHGNGTDAVVAERRFRSMRQAYGSETRLATGVTPATNDLVVAVSNRTERGMRERFESPRDAAASVRTGAVRIVVRTWA